MKKVIAIPFHGDKAGFQGVIAPLLDGKRTYIEPFGGGYSLGLTLKASGGNEGLTYVYNDLDDELYTFFKYAKGDYEKLALEYEGILTDFIQGEYVDGLASYLYLKASIEEEAGYGALEFLMRSTMNGFKTMSLGLDRTHSPATFALHLARLNTLLKDIVMLNADYRMLTMYNNLDTFWFIDPPEENQTTDGVNAFLSSFYQCSNLVEFIKILKGDFVVILEDTPYVRQSFKDCFVHPILLPSDSGTLIKKLVISNIKVDMTKYLHGKVSIK